MRLESPGSPIIPDELILSHGRKTRDELNEDTRRFILYRVIANDWLPRRYALRMRYDRFSTKNTDEAFCRKCQRSHIENTLDMYC